MYAHIFPYYIVKTWVLVVPVPIWAVSSENVLSNMCKMGRFKLSCAFAKYHPHHCSPFMHFVVSNDSVSGQGMLWSTCTRMCRPDVGFRCTLCPHARFTSISGIFVGIGILIFVLEKHDPPKFIPEYPWTLHAAFYLCVVGGCSAILSGFFYLFAYFQKRI